MISCKVTTHYPPETPLSEIPDLARRKEVASLQLIKSAGNLEHDARHLANILAEVDKVEAWRFWNLADKAALVEKYYGKTLPEVQEIIAGVEALRRSGVTGPIGEKQALTALAKDTGPGNPIGANQHTAPDKNKNVRGRQYGNSRVSRIARLKRDHPDIGRRLEAGEFKNVREAERAAGLPVPALKSPVEKLVAAFRRLSVSDRREFLAAVQAES